jgi:hypothetical protein
MGMLRGVGDSQRWGLFYFVPIQIGIVSLCYQYLASTTSKSAHWRVKNFGQLRYTADGF